MHQKTWTLPRVRETHFPLLRASLHRLDEELLFDEVADLLQTRVARALGLRPVEPRVEKPKRGAIV
jgi:hypothetical protein